MKVDDDSKLSRTVVMGLWFAVVIGAFFVFEWPTSLWVAGAVFLWSRATGEIMRRLK